MEDNFSIDWRGTREAGDWLQDDSSTLHLLSLFFHCYHISSTSDHQALDPRGGTTVIFGRTTLGHLLILFYLVFMIVLSNRSYLLFRGEQPQFREAKKFFQGYLLITSRTRFQTDTCLTLKPMPFASEYLLT